MTEIHKGWSPNCGLCFYIEYTKSREEGYNTDESFKRGELAAERCSRDNSDRRQE